MTTHSNRRPSMTTLVTGLIGCAVVQIGCQAPPDAALDQSAPPVQFYVSDDPTTTRVEREFTASDGAVLGYIEHKGDEPASTAVIYLHGIESHGGWFDAAGDLLAGRGYHVYCLDRRGSGINRENRGFPSGHIDTYKLLYSDISDFVDLVHEEYEQLVLIGLSWGGKLAMTYALAHPERLDDLVLITPGIRAKVDVTTLEKLDILISSGINPMKYFRTPIKVEMFTNTPEYLDMIERDPLRLRYATARFFLQSHRLDGEMDRHMRGNELPILLFLAGQDRIIDNDAVVKVLQGGKQDTLAIVEYEDQTHSIQFDAPRRMVDDIVRWLEEEKQ